MKPTQEAQDNKTTKHWTIVFPGKYGQSVQETWSEDQIIASYYKEWKEEMTSKGKGAYVNYQNCIDDWKVHNWAIETDAYGTRVKQPKFKLIKLSAEGWEKEFSTEDELKVELYSHLCDSCRCGYSENFTISENEEYVYDDSPITKDTSVSEMLATACGCEYNVERSV